MKRFCSILRNFAHVASGILVVSDNAKLQALGVGLAAIATMFSQGSAKPPTGGVPVEIPIGHVKPKRRYALTPAFCLLLAALCLSGCVTNQNRSLETKTYAVTRLVAKKVLADHPEYRAGFERARDDLKILAALEVVSIEELMEIVDRLPEEVADGDTALYIEAGILFFSDELGALAVKNPEQVRQAAAGMARALDKILSL